MNDLSGAIPWRRLMLVGAIAVCLAGCARPSAEDRATERQRSSQRSTGAVELSPVDRARYDAALADLQGKVVLVDFWATWCVPCVEQLPHTVDLAERHRGEGLAVVAVSMDEPSELESVRQLLDRQNAGGITNLIVEEGPSPAAMEAFEIGGGALPHYKLYDRTGALRRTFALDSPGGPRYSLEEIDAAVAELLAE